MLFVNSVSSMTIAAQTTHCLRGGTMCPQVAYKANSGKETPPTSWTPVRGGRVATIEDCLQASPSIIHKDTCQCICCTDPTVQSLQIKYCITMSLYLETMQEHGQSITTLGIADELISHATKRLQSALDQFTSLLQFGSGCQEESTKSDKAQTKKKGRAKSSKSKQAKKPAVTQDDVSISLSSTPHRIFSHYLCQVFTLNANILLENNKLKKALEVLKGGNDVIQAIQEVTGSIPYWLIPDTALLLCLEGIACVIQALQVNKTSLDSIWGISSENIDSKANAQQEPETTIKAKKRSAKGRNSKAKDASMTAGMDGGEKTVKKKGRGRAKKTVVPAQDQQRQEESRECPGRKQHDGSECKFILSHLLCGVHFVCVVG